MGGFLNDPHTGSSGYFHSQQPEPASFSWNTVLRLLEPHCLCAMEKRRSLDICLTPESALSQWPMSIGVENLQFFCLQLARPEAESPAGQAKLLLPRLCLFEKLYLGPFPSPSCFLTLPSKFPGNTSYKSLGQKSPFQDGLLRIPG